MKQSVVIYAAPAKGLSVRRYRRDHTGWRDCTHFFPCNGQTSDLLDALLKALDEAHLEQPTNLHEDVLRDPP